jgi:hypothetical protein
LLVVSYASFRATDPRDPSTALFGMADATGRFAVCNHPVALAGGEAPLDGFVPTTSEGFLAGILSDDPGVLDELGEWAPVRPENARARISSS